MSYTKAIHAAAQGTLTSLARLKLAPADLTFGGALAKPAQIRAPSFADTKFQQEQALGDWAEDTLSAAINVALPQFRAAHYGFNSKTIAGEPGFKEEYTKGILDTCDWGKRADLLLVPAGAGIPDDLTGIETADTKKIVSDSVGAIEVRSSRTEALRYIAYQEARKAAGVKGIASTVPNFTVKIEDLMKIYRWIEVFGKPQVYAQVFLDVVYAINVLDIFAFIAGAERLRVDVPQRSRKVTIFVPITNGRPIGKLAEYPKFEVIDRTTANGRHDIYARPIGGRFEVEGPALLKALEYGA